MKAWRLKGTDYIQKYLPGEEGYEGNVEDYERVHILTDEELKEERRKAFEAGREGYWRTLIDEQGIYDGPVLCTLQYKTFEAYEKSLEGGK